jgi:hypothetical protein
MDRTLFDTLCVRSERDRISSFSGDGVKSFFVMEIPSEELMTRDPLDRERGNGATSLISVDWNPFWP